MEKVKLLVRLALNCLAAGGKTECDPATVEGIDCQHTQQLPFAARIVGSTAELNEPYKETLWLRKSDATVVGDLDVGLSAGVRDCLSLALTLAVQMV
jgi:hypothetical protein